MTVSSQRTLLHSHLPSVIRCFIPPIIDKISSNKKENVTGWTINGRKAQTPPSWISSFDVLKLRNYNGIIPFVKMLRSLVFL
jgi:hypothetical protein